MEVLEANEAALCNQEVMTFLQEQKAEFSKPKPGKARTGGTVATLMLETLTSLENTPCKSKLQGDIKYVNNFVWNGFVFIVFIRIGQWIVNVSEMKNYQVSDLLSNAN